MKTVAGYIRVSTDGQTGDDKFGLEVQKEQIIDYCKRNDMQIVRWFRDEGESGAKERPGFDEIIYGDVSNPPYERVVVAKSDRVARDVKLYYYYKMCLQKKDIDLISVTENFGEMGVFANILERFTLCVAEMERENINKRTSGGRKIKRSRGGYSGGRVPYGYVAQNGHMVVDPEKAEIVKMIFQMKNEGATYREIVEAVNRTGRKTRSGGEFGISTVQQILINEKTYKGLYKYGKGEWVKGEQEAII